MNSNPNSLIRLLLQHVDLLQVALVSHAEMLENPGSAFRVCVGDATAELQVRTCLEIRAKLATLKMFPEAQPPGPTYQLLAGAGPQTIKGSLSHILCVLEDLGFGSDDDINGGDVVERISQVHQQTLQCLAAG